MYKCYSVNGQLSSECSADTCFQAKVLKVGDRVKYFEYTQVAGDRRELRKDTATRVATGEFPVTVKHGGDLFQFTKLKKYTMVTPHRRQRWGPCHPLIAIRMTTNSI